MDNILILKNVYKSYTKNKTKIEVISDLNFTLEKGKFISLQGKSGSGKSTLFNLISGIDTVDSGKIISCGVILNTAKEKELSYYKNKKIGLIFQNHNLIDEFTVLENVTLPKIIEGKDRQTEIIKKATELLSILEIEERGSHYPSELSGGEAQRVAIARALINNPEIILCDEPTGNLDLNTSKIVEDLLVTTAKKFNTTLFLVTHNTEFALKADIKYKLIDKVLKEI